MLGTTQVVAKRTIMPLDYPGGARRDGLLTMVLSGFYSTCPTRF